MAGDNDLPEEAQEGVANNNDPNNNAGVQQQQEQQPAEAADNSVIEVDEVENDPSSLDSDVNLILKVMPTRKPSEIRARINQHRHNPARVSVVLNELLTSEEESSGAAVASQNSNGVHEGEGGVMAVDQEDSHQGMANGLNGAASHDFEDEDQEVIASHKKNKDGKGTKSKNSRKAKPTSEAAGTSSQQPAAGTSGVVEDEGVPSGSSSSNGAAKRKSEEVVVQTEPKKVKVDPSLDPVAEDSSSSSSSSAAKATTSKGGRKKININEQELHGPFNFFTHRPVKETKAVSSSTSASSTSTAASDNAKSNGSKTSSMTSGSLREDLQRVLQEHEGQKSSSSSTSTKEGKPSSKDAPVVASASEKSAADVGTHVKIASPEVVDVDDTASPSPPVVVDLAAGVEDMPTTVDPKKVGELVGTMSEMFPKAPLRYLEEQCEDLVGHPAAIERFVEQLARNDSQPPDSWVPRAELEKQGSLETDRMEQLAIKASLEQFQGPGPSKSSHQNDFETAVVRVIPQDEEEPVAGPSWRPDPLAPTAAESTSGANTNNKELDPQGMGTWRDPDPTPESSRPTTPEPETEEEKANRRLVFLEEFFPTVDPEFLHQKAIEFGFNEGAEMHLQAWIDANIDKGFKDFPTKDAYEKRRKEAELLNKYQISGEDQSAGEIYKEYQDLYDGDPESYFTNLQRETSQLYRDHSINQLKMDFRYLSVPYIERVFRANKGRYLPIYRILKKHTDQAQLRLADGRRKTRRPDHECLRPVEIDLNFLKEVKYARMEEKVKAHEKEVEKQRQIKIADARENGTLEECKCCYSDEILREDMFSCQGGHCYCKDCIQRASEVAVGEGKTRLQCLGGNEGNCDESFELSVLQNALKPNLFSKWLKKIQADELEKADIEGLESCPFCPFATIMDSTPEENKVFVCQNPDCGKESCRLCHEISHIPKKCDEVEKNAEVRKRTFIENKMAEAMMRECYSCKKKFVKIDGCNKMTCQCGAKMCYLCRKPVRGYEHFYGQGGQPTKDKPCPLFSNNDDVHAREVAEAAFKAKQEKESENPDVKLKHDPTAGLQKPATPPAAGAGVREGDVPPGLEGILPAGPAERQRLLAHQQLIEQHIQRRNRPPGQAAPRVPPGHLPQPRPPIHLNPFMPQGPGGFGHDHWHRRVAADVHFGQHAAAAAHQAAGQQQAAVPGAAPGPLWGQWGPQALPRLGQQDANPPRAPPRPVPPPAQPAAPAGAARPGQRGGVLEGMFDWHHGGLVDRMGQILQDREEQRRRQRAIIRREQEALNEYRQAHGMPPAPPPVPGAAAAAAVPGAAPLPPPPPRPVPPPPAHQAGQQGPAQAGQQAPRQPRVHFNPNLDAIHPIQVHVNRQQRAEILHAGNDPFMQRIMRHPNLRTPAVERQQQPRAAPAAGGNNQAGRPAAGAADAGARTAREQRAAARANATAARDPAAPPRAEVQARVEALLVRDRERDLMRFRAERERLRDRDRQHRDLVARQRQMLEIADARAGARAGQEAARVGQEAARLGQAAAAAGRAHFDQIRQMGADLQRATRHWQEANRTAEWVRQSAAERQTRARAAANQLLGVAAAPQPAAAPAANAAHARRAGAAAAGAPPPPPPPTGPTPPSNSPYNPYRAVPRHLQRQDQQPKGNPVPLNSHPRNSHPAAGGSMDLTPSPNSTNTATYNRYMRNAFLNPQNPIPNETGWHHALPPHHAASSSRVLRSASSASGLHRPGTSSGVMYVPNPARAGDLHAPQPGTSRPREATASSNTDTPAATSAQVQDSTTSGGPHLRTDLVAGSVGPLRTRILARSSSLESAVGPSGTPAVASAATASYEPDPLEPAQPVPSTSSAGPAAPNPDQEGSRDSVAHHPTPVDSDDEDMDNNDNAQEKHEQDRIDGSKDEDNPQQQDQEVVTSTASASTSAWPTTEEMDYMSPTEVADRRALKTGGRVAGHFRAPDDDEDDEVDLHNVIDEANVVADEEEEAALVAGDGVNDDDLVNHAVAEVVAGEDPPIVGEVDPDDAVLEEVVAPEEVNGSNLVDDEDDAAVDEDMDILDDLIHGDDLMGQVL